MPRPDTPVLPAGVLDLARDVSSSDSAMPFRVTIADPDETGPLDPDTGEHTIIPGTEHYTDRPARIHTVPLNDRQAVIAGEAQILSRWHIRLPLDTEVLENQRVTIDTATSAYADTTLVGRTLRILDHTPSVFGTELRITAREEPVPSVE